MNPATTVSLHPYFKCHEGKLGDFKALLPQFVELTSKEEKCHYYDFTICGDIVFCREAYEGAEGTLAHLQNVADLLKQGLDVADLIRLEVHGPADELEKLKGPLNDLNPDFYEFQCGVGS